MDSVNERPTLAELRRLSTLREVDRTTLGQIANRLVILRAQPGEELLAQGSRDERTLYLLSGRVRLTAVDGKTREFDHSDPTASNPLARLRPSRYQVNAVTRVNYLRIDNDLLESVEPAYESSSLLDAYQVSEDAEFTEMAADNRLMIRIYQDLNADKLALPTLPQVAARIGKVMNDPSLTADRLAKVVGADPAIAAKLMRAANSPRYGGRAPITTLSNAIARIGLEQTHNLVLAFAIQELFRTGSGMLRQRMRDAWKHSRRVAAVSHVLAGKLETPRFDPSFALLAGLLHDIGLVAVLGYARECPELTQDESVLDATAAALRSQLGGAIVRRWHLPEELAIVAQDAHDWSRDTGHPGADYADLVIVAQLHCHTGTGPGFDVPSIDRTAAYRKLGLGELGPDQGVQLLAKAQEEIREIETLLGS